MNQMQFGPKASDQRECIFDGLERRLGKISRDKNVSDLETIYFLLRPVDCGSPVADRLIVLLL